MANRKIKSIDRGEFAVVWSLLRSIRLNANLTQRDLAKLLGRTQSFVSDAEIGRRRLDVLQLYDWCNACNTSLVAFARTLESTLDVIPKNLPKSVRDNRSGTPHSDKPTKREQ